MARRSRLLRNQSMLSCVAPGCRRTADCLLMGLSLCLEHRESWLQVQLSYFRTLPHRDLMAYQEFMVATSQEYLRTHPAGATPEAT